MKGLWVLNVLVLFLLACAQPTALPTSTPTAAPAPTATALPVVIPSLPPTSTPTAAPAPTATASPVVIPSSPMGSDTIPLITTASGLKYRDLVLGTGEEARDGLTAVVHYTGWLVDGTKFDSSLDRGDPFSFPIGQGKVIQGWEEGVVLMNVGGKRALTIPPNLAYGDRGAAGVIPPGATLIFEVELLELR